MSNLAISVQKIGPTWGVVGIREEKLTTKELYTLLLRLGVPVSELACMNLEFQLKPNAKRAHFDTDGKLLRCD